MTPSTTDDRTRPSAKGTNGGESITTYWQYLLNSRTTHRMRSRTSNWSSTPAGGDPAGKSVNRGECGIPTSASLTVIDPFKTSLRPRPLFRCKADATPDVRRSASTRQVVADCDRATARLIATVVLPSLAKGEETRRSRGGFSWFDRRMEACRLRTASASGESGLPKNDAAGRPTCTEFRLDIKAAVGTSVRDGRPVHFSISSALRMLLSNPSRTNAIKMTPRIPSTSPKERFKTRRGRAGVSETLAVSTTRTLLDLEAAVIPASLTRV